MELAHMVCWYKFFKETDRMRYYMVAQGSCVTQKHYSPSTVFVLHGHRSLSIKTLQALKAHYVICVLDIKHHFNLKQNSYSRN